MAIEINWIDSQEQRIIIKAEGGWTWDEYHKVMADMHSMMDASPQPKIDFILDLSRSTLFPKDMLSKMKRSETHAKSRKMVVVGAGIFAQTLFNLMENIAREKMQRIKLCKNLEEAMAFLDEA